jgi:hypothetical protein
MFNDYHEIANGILFVVLLIVMDYLIQNANVIGNDYMNVHDHLMIDYFQNDYDF